jgi:hypothetical protein
MADGNEHELGNIIGLSVVPYNEMRHDVPGAGFISSEYFNIPSRYRLIFGQDGIVSSDTGDLPVELHYGYDRASGSMCFILTPKEGQETAAHKFIEALKKWVKANDGND